MTQDLHAYRGHKRFEGLIEQWRKEHGERAVAPLLQIAREEKLEESSRYMALLGAAKLGGNEVAIDAIPFLRNPSWMLRSGALRILTAFKMTLKPDLFYSRLKDSALVIRTQAAEAVGQLKPAGWQDALTAAVLDKGNYAGGQAQRVPQKALEALIESGDLASRARLRASMNQIPDPIIRARVRNWNGVNSLRGPRR